MDGSAPAISTYLTRADTLVLQNLFRGAASPPSTLDDATIDLLTSANDPSHSSFEPTIFASFDASTLQALPSWVHKRLLGPYVRWASTVARRRTDVIFVTHILLYLVTLVPSAALLFYHWRPAHGVLHVAYTVYCAGPFTLMLHNHIHNGGVLSRPWRWLDVGFPYVLEPLLGHTWDSYYYHHVKHHHAEGNGPDDLSSTLRYQRDSIPHFLHYFFRFFLLIWVELPLYFCRKGQVGMALRAWTSEMLSYAFLAAVARWRWWPAVCVFLVPLGVMRLGMMLGNWGQHALIDEVDPASDLRSSITLIDVTSNRHSFNDGYHTSHHLNPRRHWRDHPAHLIQSKQQYADGRALVLYNIDYLFLTIALLSKNYAKLARCLVPISEEQKMMTLKEREDMLRTKTKRFSEDQIREKFYGGGRKGRPSKK